MAIDSMELRNPPRRSAFFIALKEGFNGEGAVVSYLDNVRPTETTMKLTAMAWASAFAITSRCALARTVRHESRNRYCGSDHLTVCRS
jgi:hypothetical protein